MHTGPSTAIVIINKFNGIWDKFHRLFGKMLIKVSAKVYRKFEKKFAKSVLAKSTFHLYFYYFPSI